jgi:hypothetical protein
VYAAASERYYKVAAEALRVCERLVLVLRQDVGEPVDAAMAPLAQVCMRVSVWLFGGGGRGRQRPFTC